MQLSDYDFELSKDLIAQQPLERRDASRMLTVDREGASFLDDKFSSFPLKLKKDDLLVLNNTRVFPARLLGRMESGANVEVFLVEEREPSVWMTLAKPGRRLKPGKSIEFGEKLTAELIEKTEDGRFLVRFESLGNFDEVVHEIGRTPLPPYIQRDAAEADADRERYQTVFASDRGAIAAPTAGLHFSKEVLQEISDRGVQIAEITLHVGYGTFEPVRETNLSRHRVAPERFRVDAASAEKLEQARRDGRRIIAVGTTTTRTLEYLIGRHGNFQPDSGLADLTITPGYRFQAIGALLTNFHLPQSSLLVLVATFGGHKLIMDSYRHAASSGYRFYSYGDCMFIT